VPRNAGSPLARASESPAEGLSTWQKRLPSTGIAVTIAADLVCPDGIILAADGEVTHTYVKSAKVKLFERREISAHITIIGAGAGDDLFIDTVTQKLGEQLDTNTPDLVSVKQGIEKIVLRAYQNAWPLYDTGKKPDLQILLAIKAVDGLGFFEINGPLVRGVSEYPCIGYGTDLAIYKHKHLFMPRLPLELVTPLMVHLIKTSKFVPRR